MSTVISDEDAKRAISVNVKRLLDERDCSAYWLMKKLGLKEGTFYPVVNGEVLPSVAVTARIAEALDVTVDDLLAIPDEKPRRRVLKKIRRSA
jgi:transcriptional regulator with XRE-family HTH domain